MSSTFAILEVGHAAYDEISRALKKAGYHVERDGEINMEGLHLKRKATTSLLFQPRPHGLSIVPHAGVVFKAPDVQADEAAMLGIRRAQRAQGTDLSAHTHKGYPDSPHDVSAQRKPNIIYLNSRVVEIKVSISTNYKRWSLWVGEAPMVGNLGDGASQYLRAEIPPGLQYEMRALDAETIDGLPPTTYWFEEEGSHEPN